MELLQLFLTKRLEEKLVQWRALVRFASVAMMATLAHLKKIASGKPLIPAIGRYASTLGTTLYDTAIQTAR